MKIVKIWDADYPWDVRVEKIVTTLIQNGHEVHLVCRNKKMDKEYEYVNGLHIHRLPPITKSKKINEVMGFPAFFSPFWIRKILKIVEEVRPEVILVRDLPLTLTAILAGKIKRIPVIMDMAEDYPEQLRGVWQKSGFKLRNTLVRNPWIAEIVERIALRQVEHIIVVIAESQKRLESLGLNPARISIVSNTPRIDGNLSWPKVNLIDQLNIPQVGYRLGYIGLLDNQRGVEIAIKAMPDILEKYPQALLVIGGSGKYEYFLRNLPGRLGVEKNVIFLGWLKPSTVPQFIAECDVGLIPHHAVPGWNNTIPNKLFDYMLQGKPVLVSSATAQARIVSEEECGLVFQDRNPESFAGQACKMADSHLRAQMGRAGQQAVLSKYNWGIDGQILKDVFKKVQEVH